MEELSPIDNVSADELVAPIWLNAQFLEGVLRQYESQTELKVTELKISPASAKGDHYASIMFRASLSYTTPTGSCSKSVIIKTMPEQEGQKKELLSGSHIFKTEIGMYTKVLPRFEQILREAGDNTKLYARCLYATLEPHQVMVFEDLLPQGYEVIRRRDPKLAELKLALKKLSKWHAISFHLLKEEPEYLQEFQNGLFDIPHIRENPFFSQGMTHFLEMLNGVPELKKYIPHFKRLEKNYFQAMEDTLEEYRKNRQPNGYYVLSHGDFHLKNVMFRRGRKAGEEDDVMLVDFQISNICPITIDVINSIYMLMGPQERKNYKELVDFYFAEFVATLKRIGFKGELPNSEEFWNQMFAHRSYDIYLLTSFLPVMIALNNCPSDFGDVFENQEKQKKAYGQQLFIEDVKSLLSRFEEQGFFENEL